MSRKVKYSDKILKILGEKTAISMPEIKDRALDSVSVSESKALSSDSYAITRSLKGLKEAGLIEQMTS